MKGKITVTGGCGYIGSHTAVSLIENGWTCKQKVGQLIARFKLLHFGYTFPFQIR